MKREQAECQTLVPSAVAKVLIIPSEFPTKLSVLHQEVSKCRRLLTIQWKTVRMSLIHVLVFAVSWAPYIIHETWYVIYNI